MQATRKTILPGVTLMGVSDARFKTNRLSITFFMPLKRETAAVNAMIPHLLARSCASLPDFTALNRRLAMLYGARIGCGVRKLGEVQAMTLSLGAVSDRYVPGGERLSAECARLLAEMVFHPAFDGGCFRTQDVEQEKRQLIEQIDAEFNDKRTYARARCEQLMCEGEAYGVPRLGEREAVERLTPEEITRAWKKMLRTAQVHVLLIGDGEETPVREAIEAGFAACGGREPAACATATGAMPRAPREKTERFDVSQAKLVMGFRTPVAEPGEGVMGMRLATALLGGTPHSKLFLNVREKLSLCYYCAARFDRNKGILLVDSGVEEKNARRAREEILRQLEAVQKGDFTAEEVEAARLSMADSFRTVADSPVTLENFYISQAFDGRCYTPEEAAQAAGAVGREEIIKAAGSLSLDYTYLLAGKEERA